MADRKNLALRTAIAAALSVGLAAPAASQVGPSGAGGAVSSAPATPVPCCRPEPMEPVEDRIFFEAGRADIGPDAIPILMSQVNWLKRYPGMSVQVQGNADERGSRPYNMALGARRAEAVRRFLIDAGIAPNASRPYRSGKKGRSTQERRKKGIGTTAMPTRSSPNSRRRGALFIWRSTTATGRPRVRRYLHF